MKGIILAGGLGTRLYPVTRALVKHLLPVFDKPMIYYPMSILMLAGIREILIISTPRDLPRFAEALGDGSQLGLYLSYREQPAPQGTAQAIHLAEDFLRGEPVALIFGDNFFCGPGLAGLLGKASTLKEGALIFGHTVPDPENYGVIEVDGKGRAVSLEEKPSHPRSQYSVPGLYFYDNQVSDIARDVRPSPRGEFEITDVNKLYLQKKQLEVKILGPEIQWLDAGTPENLLQASRVVQELQSRMGRQFFCIEEIAYRSGFITAAQFEKLANEGNGSGYTEYFHKILKEENPRSIGEYY